MTTFTSLTYATRRSALALAQCRAFVARLRAIDATLDLRELQVVTSGDRNQDRPLDDIGGKGLFVKEIEEALLEERAHFAVHSLKDVPSVLTPGLVIACIPKREDACDVLVAPRHKTLDALPHGARVGTSSLRRSISVKARRPDLAIFPLRGNVDTRLRKVDQGDCDAIVIAYAGLLRLDLGARATERLGLDLSLPAPGQGALGIECREDDTKTRALLSHLHDPDSAFTVAAERGILVAVGGDCRTPLGAYAERTGDRMHLRAFIADIDGARMRRVESTIEWPSNEVFAHEAGISLGRTLAQ